MESKNNLVMKKYKLTRTFGLPIGAFVEGQIYDEDFIPIRGTRNVRDYVELFPYNWSLVKDFNNSEDRELTEYDSIKKEIIGYRLIKPEYANASEYIMSTGFNKTDPKLANLVTLISCIEKLKKAEVLGIWFEPVYKEIPKVPFISINGHIGNLLENYVQFGCAEINKQLFLDLYAVKGSTLTNGREIESVTIGKGTFTKEQIKEIAEYYLNKK